MSVVDVSPMIDKELLSKHGIKMVASLFEIKNLPRHQKIKLILQLIRAGLLCQSLSVSAGDGPD